MNWSEAREPMALVTVFALVVAGTLYFAGGKEKRHGLYANVNLKVYTNGQVSVESVDLSERTVEVSHALSQKEWKGKVTATSVKNLPYHRKNIVDRKSKRVKVIGKTYTDFEIVTVKDLYIAESWAEMRRWGADRYLIKVKTFEDGQRVGYSATVLDEWV